MQAIKTVEKEVTFIKEILFTESFLKKQECGRSPESRQLREQQPLEGAVCGSQCCTEHVPAEPSASSTLCKKAALADGREAQQAFAPLASPPLENKSASLEGISPAGQRNEIREHGLIAEGVALRKIMGNQDGKLKKNTGDVHEGEDASGPKDTDGTKKVSGSRRGLGKHAKGSESSKKKGKSDSRASVFSNLRIRKNLSKAKDGNSSSREDVLESQALQAGELDSTHSVVTKTPDISISADEGGLSDTDVEHFEIRNETVPAAAETQDGQRTSSGSDTDIYSFHSATEQEDLLSDIQQAIRLQQQQQGAINIGTEDLVTKTMGRHMANSQAAPLDFERFLSVTTTDKERSPDTEGAFPAISEIAEKIPISCATERELKEAVNGTGSPGNGLFETQERKLLIEEPEQLVAGVDAVASELEEDLNRAVVENGSHTHGSTQPFPTSVTDAETKIAEVQAVDLQSSVTEDGISDAGRDHAAETQEGKPTLSASQENLHNGLSTEMKNGILSSEGTAGSPMLGSRCFKPYLINPCYIKTTTRQLSSPNHSPSPSPSQSPLFTRRQESFYKKEKVPIKKQRSASLAGLFSRSADWTEEVSNHKCEITQKVGSAGYLEHKGLREKFQTERVPSTHSRKSSGVQASTETFPNVFSGRTLLEKLFSQQENAPQEEAEKLCSRIIAMGLLLPFTDCFREPCNQSAQQSTPTFDQIKEELCWRAHSTEVVDLFHEEEKDVVVTASIDGSVRLWHAMNGYYLGYFGQPRKFELSDISRLILPCDINNFPTIIKEESKHMEKKKKFEYPLMLDRDKWKSLIRSPSVLKKPEHVDIIQDFKFFKALASPKIHRQPLETFESGNREAGAVFGLLPIYEVFSGRKLRRPVPLDGQRRRVSLENRVETNKHSIHLQESRLTGSLFQLFFCFFLLYLNPFHYEVEHIEIESLLLFHSFMQRINSNKASV